MSKVRTFSDLDLNFKPAPSAQDRILGEGTITVRTDSKTIVGVDTRFMTLLSVNDNLYINGSIIGKVASIESETSLTLYDYGKITASTIVHDAGDIDYAPAIPNPLYIMDGTIPIEIIYNTAETTEGMTVIYKLIADVVDGTEIPYIIHGIQQEDLDIGALNEDISTNLIGNFVFTNKESIIKFRLFADELKEITETMILELVGYAYINPDATYTFSTPADISLKYDENAVKASIKHLISTMNYERPFNSKIGSQARAVMFEPVSMPMTAIILKRSVINTINSFEPRVELNDVVVNLNPETYVATINIYFTILNTTEPLQVNVILEKTR